MSDRLRRYRDLLRLHERGQTLDKLSPFKFSEEAGPWTKIVREIGFEDIDARADFETAVYGFNHGGIRRDVQGALAAIAREARSTVRQMSEDEGRLAMLHWMHVHQMKADTKRIAATVAELGKELGQDEITIRRWIDRTRGEGFVSHYRDPEPDDPIEYFCLSDVGLRDAGDPLVFGRRLHHTLEASGPQTPSTVSSTAEDRKKRQSALNRFQNLTKLGEGAYADVWRADDTLLGRTVALKIVRASAPGALDALSHAKALARVSHPNIVTVHEVTDVLDPQTLEPASAVVMEVVDGPDLGTRLSLGFEPVDAGKIGTALIEAVAEYHQRGLAHADLHDENVILGKTGAKVLDPLYLETTLLRSTARLKNVQARDLRSLRDLLVRILRNTLIELGAVATFERATDIPSLPVLRSAFAFALAAATTRLAKSSAHASSQASGPHAYRALPAEADALSVAQGVLAGSVLFASPFHDPASGRACIAVAHRSADDELDLRIGVLESVGGTFRTAWMSEPFIAMAPQIEVVDLDGDGTPEVVVLSHCHGTAAGTTTLLVYFPTRREIFRVEENFDWGNAAGPEAPEVRFDPEPNSALRDLLEHAAVERGMLKPVAVDLDRPEGAVARWHKENGTITSGPVRTHLYKGRPKYEATLQHLETANTVWYAFFKGPLMAYFPSRDEHYVVFSAADRYNWPNALTFDGKRIWFALHLDDAIMMFDPAAQQLERYIHIGPRKMPAVEHLAFDERKGLLVVNESTFVRPADLRRDDRTRPI